jgi:hypothetical protein
MRPAAAASNRARGSLSQCREKKRKESAKRHRQYRSRTKYTTNNYVFVLAHILCQGEGSGRSKKKNASESEICENHKIWQSVHKCKSHTHTHHPFTHLKLLYKMLTLLTNYYTVFFVLKKLRMTENEKKIERKKRRV